MAALTSWRRFSCPGQVNRHRPGRLSFAILTHPIDEDTAVDAHCGDIDSEIGVALLVGGAAP